MSNRLFHPPGHLWRDKWTALSEPLSQEAEAQMQAAASEAARNLREAAEQERLAAAAEHARVHPTPQTLSLFLLLYYSQA